MKYAVRVAYKLFINFLKPRTILFQVVEIFPLFAVLVGHLLK